MKRHIILAVMLSAMLGCLYAQDSTKQAPVSFTPKKGDFSGAILFGRGNFITSGLNVPVSPTLTATPSSSAPGGYIYNWNVGGTSPANNTIDVNDNNVTNIVGAEMRYFLTDQIALKLSGGGIVRNNPSYVNKPGFIVTDPVTGLPVTSNAAWLPAYNAIKADNQTDVNINIGAEKHFKTKYNKLSPYAGITIPIYYGRRSQYDPTIDDTKEPTDPMYIVDVGVRRAELVGYGLQTVAGVDYYLLEGFYFGFELKPVSFVYAYTTTRPAPGLPVQKADTQTLSFFSQTFLKIGFKF